MPVPSAGVPPGRLSAASLAIGDPCRCPSSRSNARTCGLKTPKTQKAREAVISLTRTMRAFFAAALCAAGLASPAMASWPASTNPVISGTLTFKQTIEVECGVIVWLTVDAAGEPSVFKREFVAGYVLCGNILQPSGEWDIDYGPGANEVTITVGGSTILGSCQGTIVVPFNHTTNTITFNNTAVNGVPGNCTVDGVMS